MLVWSSMQNKVHPFFVRLPTLQWNGSIPLYFGSKFFLHSSDKGNISSCSLWRCRAADRSCWVLPCWPSWPSALGCLHSSQARHRSLLLWLQLPQLLLCHCQPWPASLQASASTGTGTWALAPSMARPPVSWCWSSSWRSSLLCWELGVLPGRHESEPWGNGRFFTWYAKRFVCRKIARALGVKRVFQDVSRLWGNWVRISRDYATFAPLYCSGTERSTVASHRQEFLTSRISNLSQSIFVSFYLQQRHSAWAFWTVASTSQGGWFDSISILVYF